MTDVLGCILDRGWKIHIEPFESFISITIVTQLLPRGFTPDNASFLSVSRCVDRSEIKAARIDLLSAVLQRAYEDLDRKYHKVSKKFLN